MDTSPIKQIEEALVAAIKAAMPTVEVDSYAGQLDDEQANWVRRLPAIWVTFERITEVRRVGRRKLRNTARFQIMAAQRALTNEPAGRLGAHGELGVYELLDLQVKRALLDSNLGLAIEPLVPAGTQMVLQGFFERDAVAVMSMAWITKYIDAVDEPDLVPPGELHTIGLNYPLKPGDDVPEASDIVTLNP